MTVSGLIFVSTLKGRSCVSYEGLGSATVRAELPVGTNSPLASRSFCRHWPRGTAAGRLSLGISNCTAAPSSETQLPTILKYGVIRTLWGGRFRGSGEDMTLARVAWLLLRGKVS